MKKLILPLLLLGSLFCAAQDDVYGTKTTPSIKPSGTDTIPNSKIILKDNVIIFEKTYNTNLTNEELKEKIKLFLPSVKSFQLTSSTNQNTDQFSGRLTDFIVNYRKYGGTLMGTSSILNYPLNANVIIQIRNNKYRVTISDIIFKSVKVLVYDTGTDVLADDMFTKSKRSKIRTGDTPLSIASYMSKDFETSFDINNKPKLNTEF